MAGRAVGGGVGGGCAVFSVVGVLMSVGIVVWLASIAADGTTDPKAPAPASGQSPTDLIDQIAGSPGVPGSGPWADATVTIDPATDLRPGDPLTIAARSVPPGPVEVSTCLANEARLPDGLAGCDPSTLLAARADGDGKVAATGSAHRVLTIRSTAFDCAAFAGACVVVIHTPGAPDQGASAPLTFATDLPTVDAERPRGP